ncbi:MAG: succinate dehydrogenase cytochrome b subunit [Fuerstiella sp.]
MKLLRLLDSSVGQKVIAGATGIGLVGFLVIHMAGNLQVFAGADALNDYAELLKSSTAILWTARPGLLGLIVLHIAMTTRQVYRNRNEKRQKYAKQAFRRTTRASRSMMLTGTLLLAFLIFHLLHFTVGAILPEAASRTDASGRPDVFAMVVAGFRNPLIVAVYVAGMLSLSGHLKHAISSALQTLGMVKEGRNSPLRKASPWLAAGIIIGFLVVPISVATGIVGGDRPNSPDDSVLQQSEEQRGEHDVTKDAPAKNTPARNNV